MRNKELLQRLENQLSLAFRNVLEEFVDNYSLQCNRRLSVIFKAELVQAQSTQQKEKIKADWKNEQNKILKEVDVLRKALTLLKIEDARNWTSLGNFDLFKEVLCLNHLDYDYPIYSVEEMYQDYYETRPDDAEFLPAENYVFCDGCRHYYNTEGGEND